MPQSANKSESVISICFGYLLSETASYNANLFF